MTLRIRRLMKRLWPAVAMSMVVLVCIGACSPAVDTKDLPPLGHIIGGVLESDVPVDRAVFLSTISCLVEGDLEGYADRVNQFDSQVDRRDMADVVIEGRRESDTLYRGMDLYDLRDMRWALAHIDRVKSAGIDTMLFVVSYEADPAGNLYIPGEAVYLFYLNAFHRSGFRIWLALGHCSYDFPYRHDSHRRIPPENQGDLLDMFEPHILRWAGIAERYNVDTFIPSEEANTTLVEPGEHTNLCQPKREILSAWMQRILPRIRARFSGKIGFATNDGGPSELIGMSPGTGPDFDYTGYDFILQKFPNRSVFPSDEDWEFFLVNDGLVTLRLVDRYGVEGLVIYHAGDSVGKALDADFAGSIAVRETDEQHQKKSYERYFEVLRDNSGISGMFIKIQAPQPHEPDWNPFGKPAEAVIRDNFAPRGTLPVTDFDRLWVAIGEDGLRAIQACLSAEYPFDPERCLNEKAYEAFAGRVRTMCAHSE